MGKVNLRNRLRENSNEDSNTVNKPTGETKAEPGAPPEQKLSKTSNLNRMEATVTENKHTNPVTELVQTSASDNNFVELPLLTRENKSPEVLPVSINKLNNTESILPEKEKNISEDLLFGSSGKPNNDEPPLPHRQPVITKNYPQPEAEIQVKIPQLNQHEDNLFKDEKVEEKGFKNFFNGTKSLFLKKDENIGVTKNLFDRLNINKKMFYTASGCAAIAALLVINYLNGLSGKALFGSEMVYVLVANKNITEKTALTLADLARKEIPKKFVMENAIILDPKTDTSSIVGKIALTDIYENEQIITKRLAKQENSPWLSPAVPVNHRAFTISSKALSYIKPGDHVDVLVSLVDPLDKSRTINTPVLQNAQVLAVDGKYKITANEPSTNGDSVTIAVPNKLVNFFTILQEKGNFQLALRRDGDTANLDTKYSIAQLEVMLNATDIKLEKFKPEPLIISTPKPHPFVPKEVYIPPPHYEAPVYVAPHPVYVAPRPQPRYNPPVIRTVKKQVVQPHPKPQVKAVYEAPKPPTTVFVINGTKVDKQSAPHRGGKQ